MLGVVDLLKRRIGMPIRSEWAIPIQAAEEDLAGSSSPPGW
jgi:hypothetical protein